jgi:hypothetical protein
MFSLKSQVIINNLERFFIKLSGALIQGRINLVEFLIKHTKQDSLRAIFNYLYIGGVYEKMY